MNGVEPSASTEIPQAVTAKTNVPRLGEKRTAQEINDNENLSDLDDDEINQLILTEEEAKAKSELWHEMNQDYLKELAGIAHFRLICLFSSPLSLPTAMPPETRKGKKE